LIFDSSFQIQNLTLEKNFYYIDIPVVIDPYRPVANHFSATIFFYLISSKIFVCEILLLKLGRPLFTDFLLLIFY